MTRATRVSCVDSIVKMALPDPKTTPGELGTHTGTSAVIWWRNSSLHWQLRRIQTGLENRSTLTGTQGSNPCLSASAERFKTQRLSQKP